MPGSRNEIFADPQLYERAVSPAQVRTVPTSKGDFRTELKRVELAHLSIQRGRVDLPQIVHSAVSKDRPPFYFLVDSDQPSIQHGGADLGFGEVVAVGPGSSHHIRSTGPSRWATIAISRDHLAGVGSTLVDRELLATSATHRIRPSRPHMLQLLKLHEAVGQLAGNEALLLAPEPARALEQQFLYAMIQCLADAMPLQTSVGIRQHSAVVMRLEELLTENYDRPLYLTEICASVGASERSLRICCQEHLGMGPVRYLWLRRMHLARRALIRADSAATTVARIAMDHGFWELGRFSVRYRQLFGESPSASLRRPPEDRPRPNARPFAVPDSETA